MVERRAGLAFGETARSLFRRRLGARLADLGLNSFEEYLRQMSALPGEWQRVFEALTTKETYFFRQDYQLDAFVFELLPRIAAASPAGSRLTIWSAGCSTGEETYTLAMLLADSPLNAERSVRILGTDLCPSNITAAERGVYRENAFRTTPRSWIERFFRPVEGGMRVADPLRKMVHFSVGNLLEPNDLRSVGRVDVIFCRNVFIYLEPAARKQVTAGFFERLVPGGYLLLGHSESLLNVDTKFQPVRLESDLVYQRPPLRDQRVAVLGQKS